MVRVRNGNGGRAGFVRGVGFQQPGRAGFVRGVGFQQPGRAGFVRGVGFQQPGRAGFVRGVGFQQPGRAVAGRGGRGAVRGGGVGFRGVGFHQPGGAYVRRLGFHQGGGGGARGGHGLNQPRGAGFQGRGNGIVAAGRVNPAQQGGGPRRGAVRVGGRGQMGRNQQPLPRPHFRARDWLQARRQRGLPAFSFSRAAFDRLFRELVRTLFPVANFQFEADLILAVQDIAEGYITDVLRMSDWVANHSGRRTIRPGDMRRVIIIRRGR